MQFLKTPPIYTEIARHFGPVIWLLLFPQKNTGVQIPPLKPLETLAVPTVPPFPRFLKSVTHWMTNSRDKLEWLICVYGDGLNPSPLQTLIMQLFSRRLAGAKRWQGSQSEPFVGYSYSHHTSHFSRVLRLRSSALEHAPSGLPSKNRTSSPSSHPRQYVCASNFSPLMMKSSSL